MRKDARSSRRSILKPLIISDRLRARQDMARMRPMSVLLILLSSGISMLTGVMLDRGSPGGTSNYRAIYYGARCLIHRADPYNPAEFLRVYKLESGEFPSFPPKRYLFLRS